MLVMAQLFIGMELCSDKDFSAGNILYCICIFFLHFEEVESYQAPSFVSPLLI